MGIPLLYASILWQNRHLLNPRIRPSSRLAEHEDVEDAGTNGEAEGNCHSKPIAGASETAGDLVASPAELQEQEERVRMRTTNPDLVPSMFLWKDFGEIVRVFGGWDVGAMLHALYLRDE